MHFERYEDIAIREAPFGIAVIKDADGIILEANEAYCALLGRSRSEIIGKTWMKFTHPEDVIKDVVAILNMRIRARSKIIRDKRYLRPDGSPLHARITVIPLNEQDLPKRHIVMLQNRNTEIIMRSRLKERAEDLSRYRNAIFDSMAGIAQFRDRETGEHIHRTKNYVRILLQKATGLHPFSDKGIRVISRAAMLHDIGKVGIPDHILLKEGKLTREEFSIMESHTLLGALAIRNSMKAEANDTGLIYAREIAECHHEKWDGTGYPHRLKGTHIPITARVMALADVYDALRSKRPYKQASSHAEAVHIITKASGSHFDPELVRVFLSNEKAFEKIAETEQRFLERHNESDYP